MRIERVSSEPTGGTRILVDRLWPRGARKERAALDAWAKGVAPSDALRREYPAGLDGDSFEAAYRTELDGADPSLFDGSGVVLLTAAKARPIMQTC